MYNIITYDIIMYNIMYNIMYDNMYHIMYYKTAVILCAASHKLVTEDWALKLYYVLCTSAHSVHASITKTIV